MPIGPARFAEPSPGAEVNLAILGAGFTLIAIAPLLAVTPAAVRAAGRGALGLAEPAAPVRPSRLGSALGWYPFPAAWGCGWLSSPVTGEQRFPCAVHSSGQ